MDSGNSRLCSLLYTFRNIKTSHTKPPIKTPMATKRTDFMMVLFVKVFWSLSSSIIFMAPVISFFSWCIIFIFISFIHWINEFNEFNQFNQFIEFILVLLIKTFQFSFAMVIYASYELNFQYNQKQNNTVCLLWHFCITRRLHLLSVTFEQYVM